MPVLHNPKWEKFAQLVASGLTASEAFIQSGHQAKQNAPRLRNYPLVAKRITELQARNERKAEKIALSRDELIDFLAKIVKSAQSRFSDARLGDAIKAAEMLSKMCGWNEPEQVSHNHLHLQVDASVIEQLRAGHAGLMAGPKELPAAAVVVNSETDGSAAADVQPPVIDTEQIEREALIGQKA